ncbi:hypothetical protein RB195_003436 [Necator americanus]|uniref:Uncharacterized protein n=1 Tax=Necator americanus TaxID=51031 RepID=A0ABR1DP54_NECAM
MSRFSLVILLSLVVASANQWWWEYEELPQPVFNMVDNLVTYANGLPLDHKNESVRALFEALKVSFDEIIDSFESSDIAPWPHL